VLVDDVDAGGEADLLEADGHALGLPRHVHSLRIAVVAFDGDVDAVRSRRDIGQDQRRLPLVDAVHEHVRVRHVRFHAQTLGGGLRRLAGRARADGP
jgi:hypothetical protein